MNKNLLRFGIPAGCVAIIGGVLAGIFAGGSGPEPEKAKIEAEQGVEANKAAATGAADSAATSSEAKPAEAGAAATSDAKPADASASTAGDAASKAVDTVAGAASDAGAAVGEAASSAAEATVDAAGEAAKAVEGVASDAVKAAEDTATDAAKAVEGVAEDAAAAASDAASAVKDAASSAVEGAAKAVEEGAAAVGDAVSGESSGAAPANSGGGDDTGSGGAAPSESGGEKKPGDGADASGTSGAESTAEVASAASEEAAGSAAQPAAEAQRATPSFDVVRINPNGGTVMAGRAEPGAEVAIMDGDKEIGRVQADRNGDWVYTRDQPMPTGDRELSLKDVSPGGRASEQIVVLSVPEAKSEGGATASAKAEPEATATAEAEAAPSGTVAVVQNRDGGGQTVVLQLPEEPAVAATADAPFASIDSIDYATNGEITVSGRATPGAKLNLYIDNAFAGGVVAGPDGRWSYMPGPALAVGEHALRVDSVADGGQVLARAETPLTREPAEKLAPPGETLVIVQPGNSLWRIARRTLGGGIHYSEIYQANRDQIRDPDLIYPGQIFTVPL